MWELPALRDRAGIQEGVRCSQTGARQTWVKMHVLPSPNCGGVSYLPYLAEPWFPHVGVGKMGALVPHSGGLRETNVS